MTAVDLKEHQRELAALRRLENEWCPGNVVGEHVGIVRRGRRMTRKAACFECCRNELNTLPRFKARSARPYTALEALSAQVKRDAWEIATNGGMGGTMTITKGKRTDNTIAQEAVALHRLITMRCPGETANEGSMEHDARVAGLLPKASCMACVIVELEDLPGFESVAADPPGALARLRVQVAESHGTRDLLAAVAGPEERPTPVAGPENLTCLNPVDCKDCRDTGLVSRPHTEQSLMAFCLCAAGQRLTKALTEMVIERENRGTGAEIPTAVLPWNAAGGVPAGMALVSTEELTKLRRERDLIRETHTEILADVRRAIGARADQPLLAEVKRVADEREQFKRKADAFDKMMEATVPPPALDERFPTVFAHAIRHVQHVATEEAVAAVRGTRPAGWAPAEDRMHTSRQVFRALADSNPDDLRSAGWRVVGHHEWDARVFWTFARGTHTFHGEGATDAEALNDVRKKIRGG